MGRLPREISRATASCAALTDAEWAWVLDFAGRGGESLRAYPEYHRIERSADGRWIVASAGVARRHRMAVGTIVADSAMLDGVQRLRVRAAVARRCRLACALARPRHAARRGAPAGGRAGVARRRRADPAALPRDRARRGAGLPGYPGQPKSTRQLQASSSLFYEVLRKYDAGNLLLGKAEREVLEQELQLGRMRAALERMRAQDVAYRHVMQPTPFGFALRVEGLREPLSTEQPGARIERMVQELERRACAA